MKKILAILFIFFCFTASGQRKFVLVVHGGAGSMERGMLTPAQERAYEEGLSKALAAGAGILRSGGKAVDAVETAVQILEDDPLFNAGKGSVFTYEGKNKMDASIMDGKNLRAGSVAGVSVIKNPVSAARAVMDKSTHIMLTGEGAEQFAAQNGCTLADSAYFFTEERWKSLERQKKSDSAKTGSHKLLPVDDPDNKYGTVGAVALDIHGDLAAATSTGGMTNKRFGRIGDSPIIGAGTYADNKTGAVSCTGWGEYFIRLVMAKTICDRMEYGQQSLKEAADDMILRELPSLGGNGGLIATDKNGNIIMVFNTRGMFRGYITEAEKPHIFIYADN